MSFYYQHVGEEMAKRDFPRSLGEPPNVLQWYRASEMASWPETTQAAPSREFDLISQTNPNGFQVWGLPMGAESVVRDMQGGDSLMLMGSKIFEFVGRVLYRVPRFSPEISTRIWGEPKFPIIILLEHCEFIHLDWDSFLSALSFARNYHLRGHVMKIGPDRLAKSTFGNEPAFVDWVRSHRVSTAS